jgi:enoyl-CoA hydratase
VDVQVEDRDGIAVVRMEHGPVNVLDAELCTDVATTVERLGDDAGVRAVVLTGNGRAFSAGVDLKRILDGGADATREFLTALVRCFDAVLDCPRPTVSAVDGHAIAGGCVLACAADHRVVVDSDKARVGLSELSVGVPFPTNAAEIMRWRLGDRRLGPRVWLAELVPASAAVAAGLADESAPADELLDLALRRAQSLAGLPQATYALTVRQLQAEVRSRIEARRDRDDPEVADAWASDEVRARMQAFLDATLRR